MDYSPFSKHEDPQLLTTSRLTLVNNSQKLLSPNALNSNNNKSNNDAEIKKIINSKLSNYKASKTIHINNYNTVNSQRLDNKVKMNHLNLKIKK